MLNLSSPQLVSGTPSQIQQPTPSHSSSPSPTNSYASNNRARGGGGTANPSFVRGPRGGASILPASGLPAAGFHPAPNRGRAGFS